MVRVQFPTMQLKEFSDARKFTAEAGPFLAFRESENAFILFEMPRRILEEQENPSHRSRFFAILEQNRIVSVAVFQPSGLLLATWMTQKVMRLLVEGLTMSKAKISSLIAPSPVAWELGRLCAERGAGRVEFRREQRVYQFTEVCHHLSATGHLRHADAADRDLLFKWLGGFSLEVNYQMLTIENIYRQLMGDKSLYLWCNPEPVAMAAWVGCTPNGGTINFVYVPTEFRGKGHGKAVIAALARQMLSSGAHYCSITADPHDMRANMLYKKLGAHAITDLLHCEIVPKS